MAIAWRPNIRVDIDANARKDFTFDFSNWLPDGRVIIGHEIIASSDVTIDQNTREGTEVTFWVSGIAEGTTERITVRMTLDTEPVFSDDFSILLRGVQQ